MSNSTSSSRIMRRLTTLFPSEFLEEHAEELGVVERDRKFQIPVFGVQDRAWGLDWEVEPAFTKPPADLLPLYDRSVEQKHGEGFNLRNLLFVYEAYLEQPTDS